MENSLLVKLVASYVLAFGYVLPHNSEAVRLPLQSTYMIHSRKQVKLRLYGNMDTVFILTNPA